MLIGIAIEGVTRDYMQQMFGGYELPDPIQLEESDITIAQDECERQHPEESAEQAYARAVARLAWQKYGASRDAIETGGAKGAEGQSARNLAYIHDTLKNGVPALNSAICDLSGAAATIEPAVKFGVESLNKKNQALADFLLGEVDEHAADIRRDITYVYAQGKKVLKWVAGWGLAVLILLSVIAVRAHGQIEVIRFQQDGVAVKTFAAPFTINCTVNVTCALSGGKLTINSSGAGTGTVTNIATTSPITGGPITTTGTLACATCVTSTGAAGIARGSAGSQAITFSELSGDATTSASSVVTLATKYKTAICTDGLGDGLNAITAGTYLEVNCYNDFGATYTITGIRCFTDNNGSSTLNAANDAATALLTGAVTCTNSWAAGTQSGTTTIASSHWIKFTFVADGTTKNATFAVTLTR